MVADEDLAVAPAALAAWFRERRLVAGMVVPAECQMMIFEGRLYVETQGHLYRVETLGARRISTEVSDGS